VKSFPNRNNEYIFGFVKNEKEYDTLAHWEKFKFHAGLNRDKDKLLKILQ
jgi:hypothetical protein